MKASSIRDELESNASNVKEYILSYLEGEPKELYQASAHYIKSGGKRLRPFMVTKSCEVLGWYFKKGNACSCSGRDDSQFLSRT